MAWHTSVRCMCLMCTFWSSIPCQPRKRVIYRLVMVDCGHFYFFLKCLHAVEDLLIWTRGLPHCLCFQFARLRLSMPILRDILRDYLHHCTVYDFKSSYFLNQWVTDSFFRNLREDKMHQLSYILCRSKVEY